MRYNHRKTTPKVRGGKVQRKDRADLTPNYWSHAPSELVFDKDRPGAGYRHLLKKRDIVRFLELLPDWQELGKGVRAILLAEGEQGVYGWYNTRGVVALCAWTDGLEHDWNPAVYDESKTALERLEVPVERSESEDGEVHYLVRFTEQAARGFLLMDVLLHELGHHHDRMTTASRATCARGEPYAVRYAIDHAEDIWERYFDAFGW